MRLGAVYLSLAVLLVSVAFSFHFAENFSTPKLFLLRLLTLSGFFFLALARKKAAYVSWKPSLPFFFAAGFTGIIVVQSLCAPLPFAAQSKTLEYLSWFAFLLLCSLMIAQEGKLATAFIVLEITAIPILLYGFLQHFGFDPIHWTPGGKRIFSTIGGADWFAGFLAVLLALSAIRFLEKPGLIRFLLLESEFLGIYWSYTRAPLLALLLTGFLILGLMVWNQPLHSYLKLFGLLCLAFFVTFLLLYFSSPSNPLAKRYNPITWRQDLDVTSRGYLFSKGLEVFATHFWNGAGPGNFPTAYLPYRNDDPLFARQRGRAESTHNTFLDVAAETGIFGGIVFLGLWISSLILLGMKIVQSPREKKTEELSCLAPLLVSFLCLQFIYPDTTLEALTAFFLGAGSILTSRKTITLPLRPRMAWELFLLAAALAVSAGIHSVQWAASDLYNSKGLRALAEKNWKIAILNFSSAVQWNSRNPVFYQNLGEACEGAGKPARALLYYNTSLQLNPRDPYPWIDLARLAGKYHWKKRALTAYAKALALDPYDQNWYHDAALTSLSFGLPRLAFYFSREAYQLDSTKSSNRELYFLTQKLSKGRERRK